MQWWSYKTNNVFSYIAPFQSDVAERWISNIFDRYRSGSLLCHTTLKKRRWSFTILFYVCIFYIHGNVAFFKFNPATNPLFKFNNRITRTWCVIRSKLTITIPERRHLRRFCVFIVNFWTRCSIASYVYFKHEFVCWERKFKFVNRDESIDKHIKTLVKYTFCNSNFLPNLLRLFSLKFLWVRVKTPSSQTAIPSY